MRKKKIGILTGGGDVPPLNAVISAAQEYSAHNRTELIGFIRGWEGVLDRRFVSLSKMKVNPILGGTILKSSRINLAKVPGASETVLANFQDLHLDGLIVVGGEDTLSNCFMVGTFPQVLISKTIDNDVGTMPDVFGAIESRNIVNYFTLGYPTAAERISRFVSMQYGLRSTAYSHERIIVVESMGMHAGWLALASSMGNPDFIIIPEFPIEYEGVKSAVAQRFMKKKHVIVVIAEGARWNDGTHISADMSEKDDFGHPRFVGSAAILAGKLKRDLKSLFDTRNVNSVNPSYLYRSGAPGGLDLLLAKKIGTKAIQLLSQGLKESVFLSIQRSHRSFRLETRPLSAIQSIEQYHRYVGRSFYSLDRLSATEEAKKYLSHIVKEIPPLQYGFDGF